MVRLDSAVASVLCEPLAAARSRVKDGQISLNGCVAHDPSCIVVGGADKVELAGQPRPLAIPRQPLFLMHKPMQRSCHRTSEPERDVYGLLPEGLGKVAARVGCFGRLDVDTTGLLLLGADGGLQSLLTLPAANCSKRYRAWVRNPRGLDSARFADGLVLPDAHKTRCAPATLEVGKIEEQQDGTEEAEVVLTVTEGCYHLVKRMVGACGGSVLRLHRETFCGLELPADIACGESRGINDAEWDSLATMVRALPIELRSAQARAGTAGGGRNLQRSAKRRRKEGGEAEGGAAPRESPPNTSLGEAEGGEVDNK
eukprot:Hpha_TRINITY_DN7103_c0_g1::TRINITY_DN7103_c0_g1_i1::g.29782::m.29782/K06183/rsuA; 16S rRNA pseudouridine516 synthase